MLGFTLARGYISGKILLIVFFFFPKLFVYCFVFCVLAFLFFCDEFILI